MPKRVLVVEDEPNIAESLSFLLGQAGFQVEVCGDGAGALEALKAGAPDLMVLDIMLPGIDGYEVLETVRADQAVGIGLILRGVDAQHRAEDARALGEVG